MNFEKKLVKNFISFFADCCCVIEEKQSRDKRMDYGDDNNPFAANNTGKATTPISFVLNFVFHESFSIDSLLVSINHRMIIIHMKILQCLLKYCWLRSISWNINLFLKPIPLARQPSTSPYLPSPQSSPAPVQVQSPPATTRVDLGDYDRREADLTEREKRLTERERAVTNQEASAGKFSRISSVYRTSK